MTAAQRFELSCAANMLCTQQQMRKMGGEKGRLWSPRKPATVSNGEYQEKTELRQAAQDTEALAFFAENPWSTRVQLEEGTEQTAGISQRTVARLSQNGKVETKWSGNHSLIYKAVKQ